MQTRTHKYQHQNPPVISSDSVWVSLVLVQSGSVLVCFGLVRSGSLWFNLVQSGSRSVWFDLVPSGLVWFGPAQPGMSYISPDEVLFVLNDAPRCDADSADFSSGL